MKRRKGINSLWEAGGKVFGRLNDLRKKIIEKCKELLKEHALPAFKKAVKKGHKKSNWLDITVLLTSLVTVMALRTMDLIQAEYEKRDLFYKCLFLTIVIVIVVLIWKFFCLLKYKQWKTLFSWVVRKGKALSHWLWTQLSKKQKIVAAILLIVLLAGCGFYFCPLSSRYYISIQENNGIPVGVGELKYSERKNRAGYWHIREYPWKKLIVITYEEPYGQLELMREYSTFYERELFQPAARIEVTYREGEKDTYRGRGKEFFETARENKFREPTHISYFDSGGKLVLELERNDRDELEIVTYSVEDRPQLLNSTLLRIPDNEKAETGILSRRIETDYNEKGLPEIRRLSPYIYNLYGVNGERCSYDEEDRLTTLCYLDVNGEPICNKLGIMLISFEYNEEGNVRSIRYYSDENGTERVEGFYGAFCENLEYDDYGNLKERRQKDRSESWCYDEDGVCWYQYACDGGVLTKETYMSAGDTPVRDKRFNSSWIEFETEKDGKDRIITMNLESDGLDSQEMEKTAATSGSLEYEPVFQPLLGDRETKMEEESQQEEPLKEQMEEPEKRQVKEQSDAGGVLSGEGKERKEDIHEKVNPTRNYTSIEHRIQNKRISEIQYQDENGKLVLNEEGCAIKKYEYGYDEELPYEIESYRGVGRQPCDMKGGYAAVKNTYSNRPDLGIEKTEYLDEAHKPVKNWDLGYAYVCYEHTKRDGKELIRKSYYGLDERLVQLPEKGYARVEELYNTSGFLIQECFYNPKEKAVCRRDNGVAEICYEYADNGSLIREWYKDPNGNLTSRSDTGYAVVYQSFLNGQLTEKRYEGYRGRTLCGVPDKNTGAAIITYQYNSGKKAEERYYDAKRNPVLRSDIGCAIQRFEYDAGRLSAVSNYGTDEKLILRKDTGYAAASYEYDSFGRQKAIWYYDTDNQPILCKDTGYAKIQYEYDELGRCSSIRYYGADGQPVIHNEYNCAGFAYEYENKGRRETIQYIGRDGSPMLRGGGYGFAFTEKEYDAYGNLRKERYFDKDEEPAVWKERGYHSVSHVYKDGKKIKTSFYDISGHLTPRIDRGYAVIQYAYDDLGQCIQELYFNADEKSVISTEYHCGGFGYTYDEKGNKISIKYLDSYGNPMIRRDFGCAETRREYDSAGNLIGGKYYDLEGNPVVRRDLGYAGFKSQYENGKCVETRYYNKDGRLTARKDQGCAIIRYQYDEYGQCIRECYYDGKNELTINTKYNCAGFQYEYDARGNIEVIHYIGLEDEPMVRRDYGFAEVRREYDAVGNLTGEHFFDLNGNPAPWKEKGYASYKDIYENGRCVESRYYDMEGKLTLRLDEGYAISRQKYDENGQQTALYYYDTEDKRKINTKYYCAGVRYQYDDFGNQTDVWYVSREDTEKMEKVMIRQDLGYAYAKYEYDDFGNNIRTSYYLTETTDKPAHVKDGGYASCEKIYENGNCIELSYYNAEGIPTLHSSEGYAVRKRTYDVYGQNISSLYYEANGQDLIFNRQYGCAGFFYGYDERGNETDIWYVGIDGKRMLRRDWGCAHLWKQYDEAGNETNRWFFEDRGREKPAMVKDGGYARCKFRYDEKGKCVEKRYYNFRGNLTLNQDGDYAMVRYTYDPYGQCDSERYYGVNELSAFHTEKQCAGFRYAFDERGNQTDTWYLGLNGENIICKDLGYAQIHSDYDENDNKTYIEFRDTGGKPIVNNENGYAICRRSYENGKCVEYRYYDEQDNLTVQKDGGYAIFRYEYNDVGDIIYERYYDENDERMIHTEFQCGGFHNEYDEKGNKIKVFYLGLDDEPANRGGGYGFAETRRDYDDLGRLTQEKYYYAEGEPAVWQEWGYASFEDIYDAFGQQEEREYRDLNGGPVLRKKDNYAIVRYEYDELGRLMRERYYDADEKPVIHSEYHCTGMEYGYDARGNWNYTGCLGLNEEPELMVRKDYGASLWKKEFNKADQMLREAYYIQKGEEFQQVVRKDWGYAAVERVYDEKGFWTRQTYLNAGNEPVRNPETGYAILEREYNEYGRLWKKSYYIKEGQPTDSVDGYAQIEYIYDSSGQYVDWIPVTAEELLGEQEKQEE